MKTADMFIRSKHFFEIQRDRRLTSSKYASSLGGQLHIIKPQEKNKEVISILHAKNYTIIYNVD